MSGKKRFWLAIVLLVLGASFAVFFFKGSGDKDLSGKFVLEPLETGTLEIKVTATGRLKAMKTVHVGTQVSGIITEVEGRHNQHVHKGEVLAQIDPSIYRAQVAEAQSNLSKIETQIALDRLSLARDADLFKRHIIAENIYDQDKAKLSMDQATRSQSIARLNLAKANLRYTTILSPIDGIVIERRVQIGQTVTSAFKTPRLFTIAEDLSLMRLDTRVSESDIGAIRDGESVTFSVPAWPGRTFSGIVTMVRVHPRTVNHVVTYDVISRVSNPDLALKPGMTALVTIHVGVVSGKPLISNAALVYRPDPAYLKGIDLSRFKHQSIVFRLKDNHVEAVPVSVGETDGIRSVVTGGGLHPGDLVIMRDHMGESRRSHGGLFGE
ncbi:MAG: efflux RND transporter periplasmic adaptor subunit [Nitrospiraceae bacterium]|jgi:HlyD family secretion protein|nr:efflux RND transporter periplasmic adaptor subunit [Nitrospiraceae bacterium]